MELGKAWLAVGAGERSESFEVFSRTLDIEWVTQALEATGTASVRRRKMPAEFAVWLVIGMALLRDRSIEEVVTHLSLVLGDRKSPRRLSHSAIFEARERLGCGALAVLFHQSAQKWAAPSAHALRWRGLAVYGVDGTTMLTPDTAENEQAFGRPRNGETAASYPQVRLVALLVLRSHLLANFAAGPYRVGEQTLAKKLWDGLPDHSVVIVDKGFINYLVFCQIQHQGIDHHWLCRAKPNLKWRVLRSLGDGDDLVEIRIHHHLLRDHPELPKVLVVRAVRYQRRGFRPQTLLTSLLDPAAYPANEVVELYHERWELEISFDEIKTHTLERAETLRSKTPERICQELWGLAIAYNLVRQEMAGVAERLHLPPRRLSYRHSLMFIRNFLVSAWCASPGVLPARLETLHQEISLLVLPERRPRNYPRAVKIKMTSYARKASSNRHPTPGSA